MTDPATALAFIASADAAILPAYRDAVRTYPDSYAAWKGAVLTAIMQRMGELAQTATPAGLHPQRHSPQ
jgi:hypothetical protein